ncbi:hypothetical protein, partial [Aquimarina sp. AD1]
MKYLKIIFFKISFLILFVSFSNCASFPKNKINPTFLNTQNIKSLNGKFSIVAKETDSISKKYWVYNNFFKEVDRGQSKNHFKFNSLKTYSFGIDILGDKNIKISFLENNAGIRELILEYK